MHGTEALVHEDEECVFLWVVPEHAELEVMGRAASIMFKSGASAVDAISELEELAHELDWTSCRQHPTYDDMDLGSCVVHIESDATAEVAALLLYRAANLVRSAGVPTKWTSLVLTDPDRVLNPEGMWLGGP